MKAHKYWSVGALITMLGTFYTGYKKQKSSHKYFALSSMLCMVMAIYTGHKMITGNRKEKAKKENGGIFIKGNSYKEEEKVYVNINDLDFFKLLSRVSSYVRAWEATIAPMVITEGKQAINAAMEASS